jgi:hypothetical protein
MTRPRILLFLHIFAAAVTFLPSRYLATTGRYTNRLIVGIYKVRRSDGLSATFHKDWFRH